MRKTVWLMWEHARLSGVQESDAINGEPPNCPAVNSSHFPLWLCIKQTEYPCSVFVGQYHPVSHRDTLCLSASSSHLCPSSSHRLTHTHTQTWIHARTSQLSHSACICGSSDGSAAGTHDLFSHVASTAPLPPFLFYFSLLRPPTTAQAGGSGSAARAHRLRVRWASTHPHPPSPPHHTE